MKSIAPLLVCLLVVVTSLTAALTDTASAASGEDLPMLSAESTSFTSNGVVTTEFSYTGADQTFTAPYTGTYTLEVWGAQGGRDGPGNGQPAHVGGKGGYSTGKVSLNAGTVLHVCVGQAGIYPGSWSDPYSPYNGGGSMHSSSGAAGGGATHIAKTAGLLQSFSTPSNAQSKGVLIVAGGGGGADDFFDGGAGGGSPAGQGAGSGQKAASTTSSGYSFGKGQNAWASNSVGVPAGGGGWYGGYAAAAVHVSGGNGGSGWIGGVSNGSMTNGARSGNGLARISYNIRYTVKYDANGGHGTMSSVTHEANVAKSLTSNGFSRTGYTFAGWNTSPYGAGNSYSNGQSVTNLSLTDGATVTLYAQWTPNPVTVTFDANGGSIDKTTMTSCTGLPIGNSGTDLLAGYRFINDNSHTGRISNETLTNQNVVGETVVHLRRLESGASNDGFHSGTTCELNLDTTYTLMIRAKGTGTWQVGHHQGGETFIDFSNLVTDENLPTSLLNGGTYLAPVLRGSSDYKTFVKTFTSLDSWHAAIMYCRSKTMVGAELYVSNMTLQAGGLTALPVATRQGYTFKGWFTAATGGEKVDDDSHTTILTPATATTYYAQWTPITYTVAYDANSGTGTMASQTHTYNEWKSLTPNAFTKEGYTFAAWNSNANGTGVTYHDERAISNLTTTAGATVTLYAIWRLNPVVSYDVNGATSGSNIMQSLPIGADVALAGPNPTRAGHAFTGWNTKADGTGIAYSIGETISVGRSDNAFFDAEAGVWIADKISSYAGMAVRQETVVEGNAYAISADIRTVDFAMQNIGFHKYNSEITSLSIDGVSRDSDVANQTTIWAVNGGNDWHHVEATFIWHGSSDNHNSSSNSDCLSLQANRSLNTLGLYQVRDITVSEDGAAAKRVIPGNITLYAQWQPLEMSGTIDPLNPDTTDDGIGDNISFTVPSSITFAVRPDGTLIVPTNAAIVNHGDFDIHLSSIDVQATSPYSVVADMSAVGGGNGSGNNQVRLALSAGSSSVDAAACIGKTALPASADWDIAAGSSLALTLSGEVGPLSQDVVSSPSEFATVTWYVMPGHNGT